MLILYPFSSSSSIDGIKKVTIDDFSGDIKTDCDNLYISQGDYSHFKDFFDKSTLNNSSVYLFRYQVTDFKSEKVSISDSGKSTDIDSENGFVFQMTVNLGFDIIDLTFKKDGKSIVIPAVMSPIDVIHDGTPPIDINDDEAWYEFLVKLIIGAVVVIAVCIFCGPLLSSFLGIVMQGFMEILKLLLLIATAPLRWLWHFLFPK